jgi:hemerythrin superfamily protein
MKRKPARTPAPNTPVGKIVDRAFGIVTRALADDDSATNLLIRQHDEVKALFEAIEEASNRTTKAKLFETLARTLVAHDAIEREILYPACEKKMGMTKLLGEALVEHGVIEFCLYEADRARKAGDFDFKVQVLSEMVLHHVKEEEQDFFPQVEKAFALKQLEELGKRMQVRFVAAQKEDFRAALVANLRQVLAGTLKPVKRPSRGAPASRRVQVKSAKRRKAA